jgi:hypothetical protein
VTTQAIQIADRRSPFKRALAGVISTGGSPEEMGLIRDMAALIVELSGKYFGTSSEVMVEAARDGAMALVGEGLVIEAKESVKTDDLATALRGIGIRGACIRAIGLVKEGMIYPETPSSIMMRFFSQEAIFGWKTAHNYLLEMRADAISIEREKVVLSWLFSHTATGRATYSVLRDENDIESSIKHIILLHCGIKHDIETEMIVSEKDPYSGFVRVSWAAYKKAQKRFNLLLVTMPLEVQTHFNTRGGTKWLEQVVIIEEKERTEQSITSAKP